MKFNLERILILLAIVALLGYNIFLHLNRTKIGYVDLVKTYNEFSFKKEKQKELESIENRQNNILDSLKVQIETIKRGYKSTGKYNDTLEVNFKMAVKNYQYKKTQFDAVKADAAAKFDSEIWKHLNDYVIDFSKKNSYDILMGSSGNGSVMYADPAYDVTDEVIVYVNNRYDGKAN